MKSWVRRGIYVLLGLVATAASFLLVIVAINFYDPPINPAAVAAFQPKPAVSDENNLYLALQGLNAPEGASLTAYGRTRSAEYANYLHQNSLLPDKAPLPVFVEQQSLKAPADLSWCKSPDDAGFFEAALSASIRNGGFKDAIALQRYFHLPDLKDFSVPSKTTDKQAMEVPWIVRDARCEFSAYLIGGLSSTRADERIAAIRALRADILFWRHILRADGDFASALTAAQIVGRDWSLLADALARHPGIAAEASADSPNGFPWSQSSDWNIRPAFLLYSQQIVTTLQQMARTPPKNFSDRSDLHFFKLNASINLQYQYCEIISAAADAPRDMERRFKEVDRWVAEHGFSFAPQMLYNPVGRILTSISHGWQVKYQLRVLDTAALEKMTQLSYAVHLQAIPPGGVPGYLSSHAELASHPVSGQPFVFDAADNTLSFVPKAGKEYRGRTKIQLFN